MLPIGAPSAEIIASIDGGLSPRKSLREYLAAGVTITARDADVTLPQENAIVGIISLDNADGSNEYWLVFENFYVITRYNRSRMYASSVWSLAYALKKAAR
jgi:membrane-bound lytic murein transglycosylase B